MSLVGTDGKPLDKVPEEFRSLLAWVEAKKAKVAGCVRNVNFYRIMVPQSDLDRLRSGVLDMDWFIGQVMFMGLVEMMVSKPEEFGWTKEPA